VYRATRYIPRIAILACALLLALTGAASADSSSGGGSSSGGATFIPPPPPPQKATIWHGQAIAPAGAPDRVKRVIEWGNQIIGKPYVYGGGHRSFSSRRRVKLDRGYDCSGSVSYALHGGGFLRSPLPSGSLMNWAQDGPGTWITIYANAGHAYAVIAGWRFDTSMHDSDAPGPRTGPRWSRTLRRNNSFVARHPLGY
jgi:hypothetical protein